MHKQNRTDILGDCTCRVDAFVALSILVTVHQQGCFSPLQQIEINGKIQTIPTKKTQTNNNIFFPT